MASPAASPVVAELVNKIFFKTSYNFKSADASPTNPIPKQAP